MQPPPDDGKIARHQAPQLILRLAEISSLRDSDGGRRALDRLPVRRLSGFCSQVYWPVTARQRHSGKGTQTYENGAATRTQHTTPGAVQLAPWQTVPCATGQAPKCKVQSQVQRLTICFTTALPVIAGVGNQDYCVPVEIS